MTIFCINSKCSSPNTRNKIISCKVWVDFVVLSSQLVTFSSWLRFNLSPQLSKELLWFSSQFTTLFFCVDFINTFGIGREAAFDRTLLDNMSQKYKNHISNCCEQWKLFSDPCMKNWLNPVFLVHINTQIPFACCSLVIKQSKIIRFCMEGIIWSVLIHLSHRNRSLKWFYISLHYYSCWAGQ